MWSMIPWLDISTFSFESFIGCGDALNDGPGALDCWVAQKQDSTSLIVIMFYFMIIHKCANRNAHILLGKSIL